MIWTGLVLSSSKLRQTLRRWGAGLALASGLAAGVGFAGPALARPAAVAVQTPTVPLNALPNEVQATHQSVLKGGPFAYPKDGIVFGNRERLLPQHTRGYYREYTVKTPGSRDRGARRIVCGGQQPVSPDACYYTDDHYASFRRIVP